MDYSTIVDKRVSVRDFKDDPIPEETLREIIEEAAKAPSWVDSQPWQVYVATGKVLDAIREEHIALVMNGVESRPVFDVLSRQFWGPHEQQNMESWNNDFVRFLIEHGMSQDDFGMANTRLFNAPALVYLALAENAPDWSILDLGGFAYGIMLSAQDRGIDSMPAFEIVKYPDLVAKHLGIEDGYSAVMGIALGYRSESPINDFESKRASFEDYARILR